jgi:restriction system protein
VKEQMKVFLTRGGKHGEDEDTALELGLAIIGFTDIPSLNEVKDYQQLYGLVESQMPGAKANAIGNRAGQLWTFAKVIQEGDIVVMPRKLTSQLAIGKVSGPYSYQLVGEKLRHTLPVTWNRPDVPRTAFEQDLLYSFGAFMTVCRIRRNDAERRVAAVLAGNEDSGPKISLATSKKAEDAESVVDVDEVLDLGQIAHDQIVAHIQTRFAGHALSTLVDAVLQADGWVTKVSPPGADGGVDILGGRGPLGLDAPRLCVQVKSQNTSADVTIYRTLQGSMQTFKAEQGLLVCWGGFNKAVTTEAKMGHFSVRLWDSRELVQAIYRTYERLPPEIQAELPLKRVWMLVHEDAGE